MATISAINSVQSAVVQAQRTVQQSENQVQQDNARLTQSQRQLSRDQEQLSQTQQQSRTAAQPALEAAPAPRLDSAIAIPVTPQAALPAAASSSDSSNRPQLNSTGQTIGSLINVTA